MAAAKSSRATAAVASAAAVSIALTSSHSSPAGRAHPRGVLVFRIVPLFLDAEDVGGALVAGEQVFAVLGIEEFAERLDPANDEEQIVLAAEGEHGVDEVVARALIAKLDFQA